MLNSTAADLPLMRSAVIVSQFLQLYLKKELASYIKSLMTKTKLKMETF